MTHHQPWHCNATTALGRGCMRYGRPDLAGLCCHHYRDAAKRQPMTAEIAAVYNRLMGTASSATGDAGVT